MLKKAIILLVLFIATAVLLYVAFQEPRNAASVALFKAVYMVLPDTHAFLEFYSPLRRDVSGGYIPPEVDDFLCRRIESIERGDELEGIVHFYVLQVGGREGGCIYKSSDRTKEKIAASLVSSFRDDGPYLEKQIILLDLVRLGELTGKGNFGPSDLAADLPKAGESWSSWDREGWENEALPIARSKYVEWWNLNLSWEERKMIDPLKGTIARVAYCC